MKRTILAGLAAIALSAGLVACKEQAHTLTADEVTRANAGAKDLAYNAGDTFLSCNGTDSPPIDDHTTCTIKEKATGRLYELQCSYKAQGCKRK